MIWICLKNHTVIIVIMDKKASKKAVRIVSQCSHQIIMEVMKNSQKKKASKLVQRKKNLNKVLIPEWRAAKKIVVNYRQIINQIANSSKKSSKKLIEVPNMNDFKLDLGVENRGE
jgi:hypothetical protein